MKHFLVLVLILNALFFCRYLIFGLYLCTAVPQEGLRFCLRGSRRFALAPSPLQNANKNAESVKAEDKVKIGQVTENKPKPRDRANFVPRRSRPSLPTRAKVPVIISTTDSKENLDVGTSTNPIAALRASSPSETRLGHRLRRPKIPNTTTIPSTTISSTTNAEIETEMPKEESKVIAIAVPEDNKETVSADIKIKSSDRGAIKETTTAPVMTVTSTRKKIRPVPIIINQRRHAALSSRIQANTKNKDTEKSDTDSSIKQSTVRHRFNTRNGVPIASSRHRNREPEKVVKVVKPTDKISVLEPGNPRTRTRVPLLRRPPVRSPPIRSRTTPGDLNEKVEERQLTGEKNVVNSQSKTVNRSGAFGKRVAK